MKRYGLALVLLLALTSGAAAEDNYYVPPPQFNAMLAVMDLGFSNLLGLFRSATGSFSFDPKAKSIANLRLALDATSLMTANPEEGSALAGLLASAQYPEIDFVAADSATFVNGKTFIKGVLTVHGASKPFTMTAMLNRVGKSPAAGDLWNSEGAAVGLSLEGAFKRADFGMADDPLVKSRFGDTVTLRLEMQGIKQ